MRHSEDEKDEKPNWPVIRDLFAQVIYPAKSWEDAVITAELADMATYFCNSFPGVFFTLDDLKLALHDLNIPHERNEHNNKFYYLANWR